MITKIRVNKRKLRKELDDIAFEALIRALKGKGTKRLLAKAEKIKAQLDTSNRKKS